MDGRYGTTTDPFAGEQPDAICTAIRLLLTNSWRLLDEKATGISNTNDILPRAQHRGHTALPQTHAVCLDRGLNHLWVYLSGRPGGRAEAGQTDRQKEEALWAGFRHIALTTAPATTCISHATTFPALHMLLACAVYFYALLAFSELRFVPCFLATSALHPAHISRCARNAC